MSDKSSLWDRNGQWYLRLHIPRPLRKHFLSTSGKPQKQTVRPLGDSKSAALRKRDRLIVAYGEIFDRLKAGEHMTPEQIEAAVSCSMPCSRRRGRLCSSTPAYSAARALSRSERILATVPAARPIGSR